MGLKKLVIHDFKSYGGELEIPFDGTPFVAVVGPNGSGKSNMLDAICFVIGLDSGRLRTESVSSLVHKSRKSDMFVEAEVADGSDIVVFKRTPIAFFVDGEEVTHEAYLAKWAELNVFPDAHNCVVLQGDIDSLARTDPKELGGIVELLQPASQLAKIKEERAQYASLETQLDSAAQESRKYLSARRAAQTRVDEAESLSENGGKLESMKTELHKLKARRKALALAEKRAALDAMRRQIKESHSEVLTSRTDVELMDADQKRLRSEYARKRKQLQAARVAEQDATQAMAAAEAEMAPLERKEAAVETELRLQIPDLDFAKQSVASAKKEVEAAEKALRMLDRARERERTQEDESQTLAPELRELWNRSETEFVSETALQQDGIDQLKQHAESSERRLASAQRQLEEHESEVDTANSRARQQDLKVQQLQTLLSERQQQQHDRRDELEQIAESMQSLRKEQRETSEKLQELNAKLKNADGNKQALAQRHKLLDTVERLRRAHPGVQDLLGNLVTPLEERFAVALERGLGANGDALVVDSAETALACIAQARQERLGTLEYLPLSDLPGRDLASSRALLARKTAEGKEARVLLDCARFEQRFRAAVLYALGNTAFAPDFETGMSLRRAGASMRIIDARGSVIGQNNTVSASFGGSEPTSGSLSDRSLAVMQRKVTALADKLKNDAAEETELGDREIRLSSKIDQSLHIVENAEKELGIAEQQLDSATRSYEHLQSQTPQFVSQVKAAQKEVSKAQREVQSAVNDLSEIRQEKFTEFVRKAGGTLAEWDAQLARGAQNFAELANQRQALEMRLKMATDHLEIVENQLKRQEKRERALDSAKSRVSAELEAARNEFNGATSRLERAQQRVQSLRAETESRSDEMGAAESAMEDARNRVADAEREEHRHAMALAAEIGDEDSDGVEEEPRRKRKRNEKPRFNDTETLSLDRLDAKIRDLAAEIEPLATLMAMVKSKSSSKDTTKASQVCADLDKNAEALRSKSDEMSKEFNSLKKRRAEKFNTVLTRLQTELSSIYSELVGGDAQAKLTVVQRDMPFNGIEFMVMPPNKPFTPISQLSGGERSMAALALLFACQKLYPAPFVALDEVDAALDFINVASIANYIRANSVTSQFIIVSLKQRLFQTASHLVGVYKQNVESKILTVAL